MESTTESGDALLATLTPEVRAAVDRLIDERATKMFQKMKEEYLA